MYFRILFCFLFFVANLFCLNAQTAINLSTIEGTWQVMDTKGKPAYYVEIYKENELYVGKITTLLHTKTPEKMLCTQCSGSLKNKAVLGLPILTKMERGTTKYSKGDLLDYEKGTSSPCTIWLESEDVIRVRTWWLFLYKTTAWYRV